VVIVYLSYPSYLSYLSYLCTRRDLTEYHGGLVSGLADVLVERLRAVGTAALFGVPGAAAIST
jgi:hypothetical protein